MILFFNCCYSYIKFGITSCENLRVINHFMRALIFYIFIFAFQINSVNGQTRIFIDGPNRTDSTKRPLILVDTFKTDLNHLVLHPDKIASINIFKDSLAIAKFGDAAKFGVIIIHPKTNSAFLRVDKILNNYKLSDEDKKLRICINKTLMRNPELILIENTEIEDVQITTERHWINAEDANSCERFINIITRTKAGNAH